MHTHTYIYVYLSLYTYIYIYICIQHIYVYIPAAGLHHAEPRRVVSGCPNDKITTHKTSSNIIYIYIYIHIQAMARAGTAAIPTVRPRAWSG